MKKSKLPLGKRSLTTAFALMLTLSVTYGQKQVIQLPARQVTVQQTIKAIEQQTKMSVDYEQGKINLQKKVTFSNQKQSLANVLNRMLEGTGMAYDINQRHIVLRQSEGRRTTSPVSHQGRKGKAIKVTGHVVDASGEPLVGVSVKGQNSGNIGVTDVDGNFRMDAQEGEPLLLSYVGFADKSVKANGSELNVTMEEDNKVLNEVVVTALGIKKEAKSLSYNVQQLNSDAVTTVKDANFVNSLSGKVAGVQINASSSGIGGASRVVMRGVKSINGNNNVLYVIDGIPMTDVQGDQPSTMYDGSGSTGDAISNINPDDIESISVLSGPSAAALYGSEASNGVILVTTKKGREGRLDVTYTGSFQFSHPFVMPKFQNTYGQTSAGSYDSWGSKLAEPSDYDPEDFFQTSTNFSNSVALSTGTKNNQTYFSLGSNNAQGLIHNNDYDRYNLSVRNTSKFLNDKLTLDLSYMLSTVKEQNMISQGQYFNPLYALYLFPPGADFNAVKYFERYDADRNFPVQYWPWGDMSMSMQNPYWTTERDKFINHKERHIFTASLKYDIAPWISLTGRVKYDRNDDRYEKKYAASTINQFAHSDTGFYGLTHQNTRQYYAEAFANINKYFDEDRWNITATIGTSYDQRNLDRDGWEGPLAKVPNLFTVSNVLTTDPNTKHNQSGYETRKMGLYGSAQLGYRSMAYLDVTARNDWSSKLAGAQKSFFYWSAGISGIWTEIFPQIKSDNYLNYFKTRISYSEVGNDPTDPFLTMTTYPVTNAGPSTSTFKKNSDLTAERTKSWEAGIDLVLFRNKLRINATLYHSRTYNQFFNIKLPETSGYTNMWVNGGRVDNKGVELTARFNQPLGPVDWETYMTWTLNRNKVKKLITNYVDPESGETYSLGQMDLGGFNGVRQTITEGGTLGDFYVRTLKTDERGGYYIDTQNYNVVPTANEYKYAGTTLPNYNLSWGNTFGWKGFHLGFLFTYRNGGRVVSLTQSLMDAYGTSQASADARDNGGVDLQGFKIDAHNYYTTVASSTSTIASQYVYSATNLRLQELSFGYDVPVNKWVSWIHGFNVSFVAHNLWMIYNKAPFDPEMTASTGTYNQGIDYFMQPSLRTMGFSVKVKF
ncbi:MAG: SusC/RagA family TonB-linked outer membrane protein [Prevotella sp.]|nr:SusC/RagA family TonB-linked outer membrane protein [Prevotella sp.]